MYYFKRIITVLLVLACVGLLCGIIWYEKNEESRHADMVHQYESATEDLRKEQNELKKEISSTEEQIRDMKNSAATTSYVVSDLSVNCYNKVLSIMKEYDKPVTMAVSLSHFPGESGCLSMEQAKELGWDYCYQYNAGEVYSVGSLAEWLDAMKQKAEEKGIDLKNAIFFREGVFQEDFVPDLVAAGIDLVIHHGEDERDIYVIEQKDGVNYAGAVWWWQNSVSNQRFPHIRSTSGNMVIEIGYPDQTSSNASPASQLSSIMNHSELKFLDLFGMVKRQKENTEPDIETIEKLQKENEIKKARIEEINREMSEIYKEYEGRYAK